MQTPHRICLLAADEAPAPLDAASGECTDECEAALDCHMRRFMTSIDAAAEALGQSLAAIKVRCRKGHLAHRISQAPACNASDPGRR